MLVVFCLPCLLALAQFRVPLAPAVTYYYTGTLRTPASCSNTDIQTQVTAANSLDVVRFPPSCNTAWTGDVTIPSTKGILLDGNGALISGGSINVTVNASTSTRITNLTITDCDNINISGNGTLTSARWRVDHVTFTGHNGTPACTGFNIDYPPGLLDHITTSSLAAAQEFIHLNGWHATDDSGWTVYDMPSTGSLATGTDEAIYLEDNTFAAPHGNTNNAWIESFYGARVVYRYNTFDFANVDAHGTPGNIGTRWWEYYKNTVSFNGGSASDYMPNLRAGSGILFGNTNNGEDTGLGEEDTDAYPALYQIGRGLNEILSPTYGWSNSQSLLVNKCGCTGMGANGSVAFNRDVYTDVDSASCTAGGSCTAGVGTGTTLPTTCSTNTAFWKTDEGGNWDTTHGGTNDGTLYKCTATNTWTRYYTPYTYPHPKQASLTTNK